MFIYEATNPKLILIHLHGFASSVKGSKVDILKRKSLDGRFSFFAMDMDYHTTTTTRTLEVLDALVKGFSQKFEELWLSGSSHGGYILLNYIKLYKPKKVKKLYLFAPSYSTLALTLRELGEEKCKDWLKGEKELIFAECETGIELRIHKDFAVDIIEKGYEIISENEVNFPREVPYHIHIFHGTKDNMVPVDHSRLFVSRVKVKDYIEVDDDHRLTNTFESLVDRIL